MWLASVYLLPRSSFVRSPVESFALARFMSPFPPLSSLAFAPLWRSIISFLVAFSADLCFARATFTPAAAFRRGSDGIKRRQGEVCFDLPSPARPCFAYVTLAGQAGGAIQLEVTVDDPKLTTAAPWVQHVVYQHALATKLSFPIAIPAQARRLRIYAVRRRGDFDYADVTVAFFDTPAGMQLSAEPISSAALRREASNAGPEAAAADLSFDVARPSWVKLSVHHHSEAVTSETLVVALSSKGESDVHAREKTFAMDVSRVPSALCFYCQPGTSLRHCLLEAGLQPAAISPAYLQPMFLLRQSPFFNYAFFNYDRGRPCENQGKAGGRRQGGHGGAPHARVDDHVVQPPR